MLLSITWDSGCRLCLVIYIRSMMTAMQYQILNCLAFCMIKFRYWNVCCSVQNGWWFCPAQQPSIKIHHNTRTDAASILSCVAISTSYLYEIRVVNHLRFIQIVYLCSDLECNYRRQEKYRWNQTHVAIYRYSANALSCNPGAILNSEIRDVKFALTAIEAVMSHHLWW